MRYIHSLFIAVILFTFCSCQKVIHINLNNSDPRYVIEGNISDKPGPYLVKISKTVNFEETNTFPAVSGAVVMITDNTAGVTDTLHEYSAGSYATSILTGLPGHTYRLYVKVSGQEFTALSTIPQPVTLDSLYSSKSPISGDIRVVPVYFDPVSTGNYYHFAEYKNNEETDNIYIRNDLFLNGQLVQTNLNRGGGDIKLDIGDSLKIDMQCIDSSVYQYYYSLQQTKNQNAATPANPVTNIKGGALGYFSAHTSSSKSILLQ